MKGFGSPGLTTLEAGAMVYELAKADLSLASFILVHNAIGMSIIEALGSDEQKQRMLPPGIQFKKLYAMGLTEP